MTESQTADPDDAYCTRAGWHRNDDGTIVFTATLAFPNGPPNLSVKAILGGVPLRLVLKEPTNA